jgi:hypothetical protein
MCFEIKNCISVIFVVMGLSILALFCTVLKYSLFPTTVVMGLSILALFCTVLKYSLFVTIWKVHFSAIIMPNCFLVSNIFKNIFGIPCW